MTIQLSDRPLPSEPEKPESEKITIPAPPVHDLELEEGSEAVRTALESVQKSESEKKKTMDLAPGVKVVFTSIDFALKRPLEILDANGDFLAKISRNLNGNKERDRSFTLELADGRKVLIPVPYQYFHAPLSIETVRSSENPDQIFITNNEKPTDPEAETLQYRFSLPTIKVHHIETVWSQHKKIKSQELAPSYQEVPFGEGVFVVFLQGGKVMKQVYKIPETGEYILRDEHGKSCGHFLEGNSYKDDQNFQFKIENGNFYAKGKPGTLLTINPQPAFQKVEAGCDAVFSGTVYGGREIYTASYREVGLVKEGYEIRNEDSAGYNQNTVVVDDGIGGYAYGAQISSFGVESLLMEDGPLREALAEVHEKAKYFTRCFRNSENPESLAGDPPDTVMAAVRFRGNRLEDVVLGDSKVYVLRGSEIVYQSKEHKLVNEHVKIGKLTPRQAMTADYRNVVTTTLVSMFYPDYHHGFELQPGDMIVLCSDGGIMPEKDLIECVKDRSAESAGLRLIEKKRQENFDRGTYYPVNDGEEPKEIWESTCDNTSYIVVRWD